MSRDVHSCTHQLRPHNSPPSPHLGSYYEGPIGQQRQTTSLCYPLITRNQKPTIFVGSQAKPRHKEDEPRCPLPSRHLCHVCAPSVSGPPFSSCHAIVAPFPPSVVTNPKLSSSAPLLQYDALHQRKHFLISCCCLLGVLLYFVLFCCICRVAWRSYGAVLWDSSLSLLQTDQAPSISRLSAPLYSPLYH